MNLVRKAIAWMGFSRGIQPSHLLLPACAEVQKGFVEEDPLDCELLEDFRENLSLTEPKSDFDMIKF